MIAGAGFFDKLRQGQHALPLIVSDGVPSGGTAHFRPSL